MQEQLQTVLTGYQQPWLDDLDERLESLLQTSSFSRVRFDTPAPIGDSARAVLESELNAVSIRVHLEQLEQRQQFETHTPSARTAQSGSDQLTRYHHWVTSAAGRAELERSYPEMHRIFAYKVDQLVALVSTVLERFDQDLPALSEAGFPVDPQLLKIDVTSGDPHQGGQRVCILHTATGKIVFKPRSLAVDTAVGEVAHLINDDVMPAAQIQIPEVLDCGQYGWQEYIAEQRSKNLDELADYYTSLGSLTAFFAALGGHDLHYENVTTHRTRAVPLDLEAALGNQYHARKLVGDDLITRINQVASTAGARTMILPPLMRNERFDIDLSPLTDGSVQQSDTMQAPSLNYSESGNVQLGMEGSMIVKPVPYPEGASAEDAHPRKYFHHFARGFQHTAQTMRARTPAIKDYFQTAPTIPNRCIIRPTSTYAAFLDTSYHPQYLVSRQARSELFEKLGRPPGAPEILGELAGAQERVALLAGDIPYFTDVHLEELLEATPGTADQATQNFQVAPVAALEAFWAPSQDAITMIQHGSFAGLDDNVWSERQAEDMPALFSIDVSNGFAGALNQLADRVLKMLIWDGEGRTASMLYQRIGADHRVQVTPLDFTYYDGQGVLHLLDAAYRHGRDQNYEEALRGLLTTCVEETPVSLEGQQVSSYIDRFSQLRLVPLVSSYLGRDQADRFARNILSAASERLDTEEELTVDYVTGLAGALGLLNILAEQLSSSTDFARVRQKLVDRLDRAATAETLTSVGLAHGPLGPLLALIEAGQPPTGWSPHQLLNRADSLYYQQAQTAGTWNPTARQGWCTGIPGLLEAWLRIAVHTEGLNSAHRREAQHQWAQAKEDLESFTGRVDFSLCHGVAGALETWQRISELLSDPLLTAAVQHTTELFQQRLDHQELTLTGGVRHADSHLGHLLGVSGALTALNTLHAQTPVDQPLLVG